MERAHISEKKNGFLGWAILSLLFMAAFGVFALVFASFLLSKAEDPLSWIGTVGVLLPALTAFFGGIICGKLRGGVGALSGLCVGVVFVLLLLALSYFTAGSGLGVGERALSYALLVLLSVLGGTLGTVKKRKRRHKRRK